MEETCRKRGTYPSNSTLTNGGIKVVSGSLPTSTLKFSADALVREHISGGDGTPSRKEVVSVANWEASGNSADFGKDPQHVLQLYS